jgi:hypothetical protein
MAIWATKTFAKVGRARLAQFLSELNREGQLPK